MQKSQKKVASLNEKPRLTCKPDRGVDKISAKAAKSIKTEPKAIKKLAATPKRSAGDSKQSIILVLLQRSGGATIDDMAKATGWQRHSVHGMMSGVLRKRLGISIASDKEECGRVYRITGSVSRL